MQLITPIQINNYNTIDYNSKILNIGTCFADNIGNKLAEMRFNIINNPNGIVYNPITINEILTHIVKNEEYSEDNLIYNNGLWYSFLHHGKYSSTDKNIILNTINDNLHIQHDFLKKASHLIITFGSSVVYIYNNKITGNCHKLPNKLFTEKMLSVDEIVNSTSETLKRIRNINPELQIIITISPVRYAGKSMHNNQINKAILLLATEQICKENNVIYFPSYEILLDELRDYRFYAEDMIHPSESAIKYIWEKFCNSLITTDSRQLMLQIDKINKSINHRALHTDSEEYYIFKKNLEKKIQEIRTKYPNIHIE